VANGVPEIVAKYAPLVRLHSEEQYWPMDAGDLAHSCSLRWATGKGTDTVWVAGQKPAQPSWRVNLRRLAAADGSAYLRQGRGIRASDHTRPYDSGERAAGLGLGEGFCLTLFARGGRKGTPSTSSDRAVYTGTPVYYEYEPDHARITYWFCYGGSTAPLRLVSLHEDFGLAMAAAAPALRSLDPTAVLAAAQRAYPSAIEKRGRPSISLELNLDGAVAAWRALQRPVALLLPGPEFPFMHEGDWERITVYLGAGGEAVGAAYYQHHGAQPLKWRELELAEGRPVVYSAQGSHASLPHTKDLLDAADAKGRVWRTWENLEDVHQSWFGFGGGWGRLGPIADATGPLGPSRWKRAWEPPPGAFS